MKYFRVTRIPSQPPESPGIFLKTEPVSNNEHILFRQNLYPTHHFRLALTPFTQPIIPHMIPFWANQFFTRPFISIISSLVKSNPLNNASAPQGFIQHVPNCIPYMTRCPLRSPRAQTLQSSCRAQGVLREAGSAKSAACGKNSP